MSYEPSPPTSIYTSNTTTTTTTTAFRPHAPGYTSNPNTGDNNNPYALTVTAPPEVGSYEAKRKRGRPRKYSVDGSVPVMAPSTETQFESPATADGKKPRGRPKGSANKQHQPVVASGVPGAGFMPHILDVNSGEDILGKLVWFSQNSTRALCILSASGAISNVTLQQATSGGTVTYEGRFEILSLSGSFMVSENDGQRIRTGGLSVSLSGPDGRVLGGNVAGILVAASPVQVIIGSFVPKSQEQSTARGSNEAEVVNAPAGGSLSESSGGGLGSPLGQSNNSNPQGMASMPWR